MLWYVANIRLPTEKAHGYQIMKMCEAFASCGVAVTLVVPDRYNPIIEDPFAFYGMRKSFDVARMPVIQSPWYSEPAFTFFLPLLIMSFMFQVHRFLTTHAGSADLLYTRDPESAWLLSRRFGVVYEAHGWGNASYLAWAARSRLTGCVAVTRHLAELYICNGFPAGRVFAEHDGADPADFEELPSRDEARRILGLPADIPLVGYVGKYSALGMKKGVETFMDAVSLLPRPAHGVIVGGVDDELNIMKAYTRSAGATDRFSIIPFVPHARALLYMRAMDVLVLPSPPLKFFAYHSSPLKLFEYMASGTPIVTSDLPALREVIVHGETALLAIPDDADSFASAIMKLIHDPARGHAIALRAAEQATSYSWLGRARRILSYAYHTDR